MTLTAKTESGREITDLNTWKEFAPPKAASKHWQDYRSAKELARCWCRGENPCCPTEMSEILNSRQQTRELTIKHAVAEMEIDLDGFRGGRRNADLAFWGCSASGICVAGTVEAKSDESFDKTLSQQLEAAKRKQDSNIQERVDHLCRGIIGRDPQDDALNLPYQLFPALSATARLAKSKGAKLGVLIVHEFVSLTLDFDKLVQNANSYKAFIHAIPGWETQSCKTGRLMKPIKLRGSDSVPNDVQVTIGKIRTKIPLHAGGREYP